MFEFLILLNFTRGIPNSYNFFMAFSLGKITNFLLGVLECFYNFLFKDKELPAALWGTAGKKFFWCFIYYRGQLTKYRMKSKQ